MNYRCRLCSNISAKAGRRLSSMDHSSNSTTLSPTMERAVSFLLAELVATETKRTKSANSEIMTIPISGDDTVCAKCEGRLLQQYDRDSGGTTSTMADDLTCPRCGKCFKQRRYRLDHLKRVHNAALFQCTKCGREFKLKRLLEAHLTTSCSSTSPMSPSSSPDVTPTSLTGEAKEDGEVDNPFYCVNCHRELVSAQALALHSYNFHGGPKPFSCPTCTKSFTRKSELNIHERIHTGERPYPCDQCDASFSQKANLMSHVRLKHAREKRHVCKICVPSLSFARARLLKHHQMSKHTGERPHKCQECPSSFVSPDHLQRHLKIHRYEKSMECSVCKRRFRTKGNLTEHSFTHSLRKPFTCDKCGIGFTRKVLFKTHLQVSGHGANP